MIDPSATRRASNPTRPTAPTCHGTDDSVRFGLENGSGPGGFGQSLDLANKSLRCIAEVEGVLDHRDVGVDDCRTTVGTRPWAYTSQAGEP